MSKILLITGMLASISMAVPMSLQPALISRIEVVRSHPCQVNTANIYVGTTPYYTPLTSEADRAILASTLMAFTTDQNVILYYDYVPGPCGVFPIVYFVIQQE